MNLKWAMVLLGIVVIVPPHVFAGEPVVLKTQTDRESYSIGVSVIRNFKQHGLAIDLDVVMQGMKDALTDRKLLLTEAELRATLTAVQSDIRRKQRQAKRLGEADRKRGRRSRPRTMKSEGEVTLPTPASWNAAITALSLTGSSSTALPEQGNLGTSRPRTPLFPGRTES